jgi:carbamoyl-phosphate synthase small subunit
MTGYQEILTDPSYARQIVTLTYPHIGNTGVNAEDEESARLGLGLVIRDLPLLASSWRSAAWATTCAPGRCAGIADIDTRRLTRILREKGAQSGCLQAGEGSTRPERALAAARSPSRAQGHGPGEGGHHERALPWTAGSWSLGEGHARRRLPMRLPPWHVVAYDFGIKRNILRMLADRGCRVTVVPAQTPAAEVLAMSPTACS